MKNLAVSLVIDRSGSMALNWAKTVEACNEYITGLAAKPDLDPVITVTVFDSESIDVARDAQPAKDVKPLTADEFPPRGLTPLLDAVGRSIEKLTTRTARADESVALVVMTDGEENASSDYTREKIKELLAEKQDKENWLVIFLGQGIDAWAQGGKIGTYASNTVQYAAAKVGGAMRASLAATMDFMETGSNDVGASYAKYRDELKEEGDANATGCLAPKTSAKKDEPKVRETSVKGW